MWDSWCVNVNSYVFCAVITIPLLLSIVKLQKFKGYHQLNCTFPFFQLWRNMNIVIWYNNYMVAKSLCGELLDVFVSFSIWSAYYTFLLSSQLSTSIHWPSPTVLSMKPIYFTFLPSSQLTTSIHWLLSSTVMSMWSTDHTFYLVVS